MEHVHHLTYARKYREDLEDLLGVCNQCHDFIHAISDFDPRLLKDRILEEERYRREWCKAWERAKSKRDRRKIRKQSKCPWERFVAFKLVDGRLSESELWEVVQAIINYGRWRNGIETTPQYPSRFDVKWQSVFVR